jgi:two-component system OmpR family response regulator
VTHHTTAQESGRNKSVTILIVEDDAVLREFLRTALADEFDVVDAVTGDEAVELARQLRPDVVILDVMLPGRSGLDVVREIRADSELRDTPVLVMTAFSDIDSSEAEVAGADRFLSKPFDLLELTETVRELIGQDR